MSTSPIELWLQLQLIFDYWLPVTQKTNSETKPQHKLGLFTLDLWCLYPCKEMPFCFEAMFTVCPTWREWGEPFDIWAFLSTFQIGWRRFQWPSLPNILPHFMASWVHIQLPILEVTQICRWRRSESKKWTAKRKQLWCALSMWTRMTQVPVERKEASSLKDKAHLFVP